MGWLTDKLAEAGESIIDTINDLLKDTGEWASDLLDVGTKTYNKFIDFAFGFITKDITSTDFQDFWDIVNYVNNIFSIVASGILVFMFVWSMFNTSVQHKAEFDIVTVLYDLAKLIFGVFLVSHALDIVIAIFRFGSNLATLSIGSVNENFTLTNPNQGLNSEHVKSLELGVSGLSGLLIVIVAILGAIVMMACAVMIIYEILKRVLKIFCIVPFASLSFTTYIMADGQGNEIFKGYIKNVLSTSLEAVVIVLCIAFSSSLSASGTKGFMGELFDVDSELNLREVVLQSDDDYNQFITYCDATMLINSSSDIGIKGSMAEGFDRLNNIIEVELEGNKYNGTLGSFDFYYIDPGAKVSVNDKMQVIWEYDISAFVGNNLGLGAALFLVLQCVVPMILTAGAVKEAPIFCSKALGM